jgi:hypothetical protein
LSTRSRPSDFSTGIRCVAADQGLEREWERVEKSGRVEGQGGRELEKIWERGRERGRGERVYKRSLYF